ncbi:JmjC domain-containing protein 4 [Podila epigama]|nr:JmjC domain-containing protein 4 [Podila epigama]
MPRLHAERDYSHLSEIPYCSTPPSYREFLEKYLEPNIPVLIGPTLTQNWRARQEWVTAEGKPDFERLRNQLCLEPVQVPVADCHAKDFTDQKRSTMDLRDFLDQWQALSECGQPARIYLKDFHFVKTFPTFHAYETPEIFRDDWMNEFWTRRDDMDDDYRFVYCGGDSTFTPFHADVYRSYSWSANICGVKKWTLFPPGQEHLFKDSLHNNVYDIEDTERNARQFPDFEKAKRFVLFQKPGETLFVPSGWWHQVQNIGDTISINHNWSNGSNLDLLLESIVADLNDVEQAIDHLKDTMETSEWIETCQSLLLLNSGWDWATLWQMCMTIRRRIVQKMSLQIEPPEPPESIWHTSDSTTSTSDLANLDRQQDSKVTPLFPPPLLSQQPALEVTLARLDAVLDFIRDDASASWFLKEVKGISVDK